MKRLFIPALIFGLISASGFCQDRTTVKNWSSVQTYDVPTLKGNIESQMRKTVGIQFNFRGKDIRHLKPNWYEGSVWQKNPRNGKFVDVRVMVAKKDLAAFKSLPTDANSPQAITVYGEVLRDVESNFDFVRLLGRNAAVDSAGNATLSW